MPLEEKVTRRKEQNFFGVPFFVSILSLIGFAIIPVFFP